MNLNSFVKIIIPVVLLGIIFYHVDFSLLLNALVAINLKYLFLSFITGYILFILCSALRWKFILRYFYGIRMPYPRLLRYYWEGIFAGYFVPGGVGADIYRAIAAGRDSGNYEKNAVAVLGEKLYILLDSVIFVILIYAFVVPHVVDHQMLGAINNYFYPVVVVVTIILPLLMCCLYLLSKRSILNNLRQRLLSMAQAVICKIPGVNSARITSLSLTELTKPFFKLCNIFILLSFTFLNRILISTGGYFLLLSFGAHIPFIAHFFVWTMATILFSLPVSFGTLGVREGAHILLLGLFGIKSEIALAASFAGLACLLTSTVMGGFILLGYNILFKQK
ncbi:lysylphosphatidylglycerol synthase transmembrane domain-containing protein [Desulfonatronovibrio magnus]|uniref:lysylphosphatidylglycerol synthase transmembrane domain-containing protein n=1 Tax=Desulfonatronovibrio magnus TaxID=698827 RepID=UPI0005EB0E7E|nr:lysylphosphatidylglycerol synthase transmembrane domain-containing protein [Desulfonatronovibrio magnus]